MTKRTPKLCCIAAPHPYLVNPEAQAPLGLLYVAAAARELGGSDVSFVDLRAKQPEDGGWFAALELPEADIYGITGTCLDVRMVNMVARSIKAKDRGARVIVGGPLSLSRELIDPDVDAVVHGEGEYAILDVFNDWPRLRRDYFADRITELDKLPMPARDLLEGHLGGGVFAGGKEYFAGGSTVLSTSRGCPSACHFCASVNIWKRRVYYRSAASVSDEIDHVVDRYGVRQLRFSDDNLTCNRPRLEELCGILKGREIAWRCSIRVKPNDIEMFRMMKAAGCTEVCFGVESGDDHVLHSLNKGTSVKANREAVENAHAAGLAVRLLMMCGCPGETDKTVARNIEFLESIEGKYDALALTNFTPLPGTRVASHPDECGCEILNDDIDNFNVVFYGPDGERKWENLVRPVGLTVEQLSANKERMREYAKSTGKLGEG